MDRKVINHAFYQVRSLQFKLKLLACLPLLVNIALVFLHLSNVHISETRLHLWLTAELNASTSEYSADVMQLKSWWLAIHITKQHSLVFY